MKIDIIRLFLRWYLRDKAPSQEKDININRIRTILIMSNTAIGDTLFATPAIRILKEKYPDKKVVALLNPVNYQLFDNNPYIDQTILYRGKWRNFLSVTHQLKRLNIDLTFIMHSNEPQATPLAYFSGSEYIIKIPNNHNEFNFLHHNRITAVQSSEHFIDRRLKQLEYIGIYEKSYRMEIFPEVVWRSPVDNLLKTDRVYIGFQIGASTNSRMWFMERWAELAAQVLNHDKDWHIVLTGSKADQPLVDSFQSIVKSSRVLNTAGKLDLGSAAMLLGKLDLLVTPDTGPLHMAAAMNTPTVAISVAGNAIESNPRSDALHHIFIQKPKTCDPCLDKRCKHQECMLQITASEVFEHICEVL